MTLPSDASAASLRTVDPPPQPMSRIVALFGTVTCCSPQSGQRVDHLLSPLTTRRRRWGQREDYRGVYSRTVEHPAAADRQTRIGIAPEAVIQYPLSPRSTGGCRRCEGKHRASVVFERIAFSSPIEDPSVADYQGYRRITAVAAVGKVVNRGQAGWRILSRARSKKDH